MKSKSFFSKNTNVLYTNEFIFSSKYIVYIFIRILKKKLILFHSLNISSDAFELDANVANFVYYGKTRMAIFIVNGSKTTSHVYGLFTLHETGTGTREWWVSLLFYVLYTLHKDRNSYREQLFSIVPVPVPFSVPVPVPYVYEPLVRIFSSENRMINHLGFFGGTYIKLRLWPWDDLEPLKIFSRRVNICRMLTCRATKIMQIHNKGSISEKNINLTN